MKFVTVFLLAYMVLLSFTGMVKPVVARADKNCCHRTAGTTEKPACQQKNAGNHNNGCDKQSCSMMLSCSICGFFGVEALRLQSTPSNYIPKPTPLYKIGDLSSYYPSDWKPPKTC